MGHQIPGTAWNGATATAAVRVSLLVGTSVTSRVMPARMISEIPTLLFSTLKKVKSPCKMPNNCNMCSRSREGGVMTMRCFNLPAT